MTRWPELPLVEVARLTRGTEPGSASYTDPSRGVRFLRVGDLTGKTDNPVYTDSLQLVLVSESDVLLTLDGSPGHVSAGHRGAISSGIRKVEPINPKEVSPSWLRYGLLSPSVQETIRRHTTGITILHASLAVPHIRVAIPSFPDQERIVRTLDEADTLRCLRSAASLRLAELRKAFFNQLLQTRDGDWRLARLEELCSKVEDCPHSTPTYAEAETPYLCVRSSDIQDGRFDWSTTKYVDEPEYRERVRRVVPQPGDVVYCREGARLGNAAIVPDGTTLCLGQRMMLFRAALNIATSELIWALLHSSIVQQQVEALVGGAASPHINVRDIRAFKVVLPPFSLQQEFSDRIAEIRALEAAQTACREGLDALFQALLHRAFQGEL